MKKVFVLVFCVLGFILIAAPTAVEYHQVYFNGQPFAQAALIEGKLLIPVEAVAKAISGGGLTLEDAHLTINAGKLNALVSSYSAADSKHKGEATVKISPAGTVPYKEDAAEKQVKGFIKGESKFIKGEYRPLLKVNRAGTIGTVIDAEGKKWISLQNFVEALGARSSISGNLKTGEVIQLNFTKNLNAILIGL